MKALLLLACLLLGACRSEIQVVGLRRVPTDPESVVDYTLPPQSFQELAQLSVDAYSNEGARATAKLHLMAARLGANGILLGAMPVSVDWNGPRDSTEKPRVPGMTTFRATAIWVPHAGPAGAPSLRPVPLHYGSSDS